MCQTFIMIYLIECLCKLLNQFTIFNTEIEIITILLVSREK